MQRALAASQLAAHHLQTLRVCEHCQRPLRPLFCAACRLAFCRCRLVLHEQCDGVRRHEQLLAVLHALNAVAEWARLSRVPLADAPRSPICALTLRVRPPPPTVWLVLRVRPPPPCTPSVSSEPFHALQAPGQCQPPSPQARDQSPLQATKSRDDEHSPLHQSPVELRARIRAKPPIRRTKRRRVPSRRTQQTGSTQPTTSTQPPKRNQTLQTPVTPHQPNISPHSQTPSSQQTTQPPPRLALDQPQPTSATHSQPSPKRNLRLEHPVLQHANAEPPQVQHATQIRHNEPDLAASIRPKHSGEHLPLDTQHSAKSSSTAACDAPPQHSRRISKRRRSTNNIFDESRITPPMKKRKHIRKTTSAPTTTVVKTSTRLKVSQSAPSEPDDQGVAERQGSQTQLAPGAKVAPVIVEQPFVSSSLESKQHTNYEPAPLGGDCQTILHSEGNVAKSAINNAESLRKADVYQGNTSKTLQKNDAPACESHCSPQDPPTSKEFGQAVDGGDIADDKLSEGTTNPCGREDGYQDDPITPIRDRGDGKHLKVGNELPGAGTTAEKASKHTIVSDWNSRSPRSFISPLTTEKPKLRVADDSNPKVTPIKPIDILSGAYSVCLSDFSDDEQYELVFEIITQMGGEPLEHMRDTRPNCLITPLDPRTGAIKSRKMAVHLALALRVPIVGVRWLLHSFKAGRWMPTKEYDASASFHKGATGIFKGLIATIDELFLEPDVSETFVQFREDIKRLIVGAEGVVVDSEQLAKRVDGNSRFTLHVHVVKDVDEVRCDACPELQPEKMEALRCMQDKIPMKVINMSWLSECLFNGQCPPPESSEIYSGSTVSPIPSR